MNIVRRSTAAEAGLNACARRRRRSEGAALAAMLGAAALLTAHSAHAANYFDDTYVAPMLSYALADDDRHADDAFGGTLGFGWRLSERLEVELRGMYMKFDGEGERPCGLLNLLICANESQKIEGGGFGTNLFLNDNGGPYLHLDVMAVDGGSYYHPGLGWDLRFSDSGWGLRAEALLQADGDFDYKEPLFNLGVRIPLGAQRPYEAPPQPVEPVRVVEPVVMPPPPPPPCELPKDGGEIDFSGCKTGDKVVLYGVNFEFDRWALTTNAKTLLDLVVTALQKRPDITVEVAGHTDAKGSDSYNQKLSDKRAASVMGYLVEKGIAAERITAVGYGESQPVADNATDEGRELNRRVEMKVLSASGGGVSVAPVDPAAPMPDAAPAPAPAAPMDGTMPPPPTMDGTMPPPPAAEAAAAPAVPGSGSAVSIQNMAFTPASLTVPVGTTVVFTNNDGSNHIIEFADGVASPRLAHDKTFTRTFTAPGTYPYVCRIHPQMAGTIVVQ